VNFHFWANFPFKLSKLLSVVILIPLSFLNTFEPGTLI